MGADTSRARVVDRRRLIIDAARSLFSERSYDQVTTTEIAATAGVAYGLLAHHFENKRGLYRAVMNEIAAEIADIHLAAAPPGSTLVEQLRQGVRNHIAYIDTHAESFAAFVRGDLGSDPEHQAAIDDLRWLGARRILNALGISEPVPAVLRTAMRGWVGYLDEMMIDRIKHRDLDTETLVSLAIAALIATLDTTSELDPTIGRISLAQNPE